MDTVLEELKTVPPDASLSSVSADISKYLRQMENENREAMLLKNVSKSLNTQIRTKWASLNMDQPIILDHQDCFLCHQPILPLHTFVVRFLHDKKLFIHFNCWQKWKSYQTETERLKGLRGGMIS